MYEQIDGNAQGTGVGLALVRRIAEVHGGGKVWAEFTIAQAGGPGGTRAGGNESTDG